MLSWHSHPWAKRIRLFLGSSGHTNTHTLPHTHKLPPCCLKEYSSTLPVTDFDEHVIKVTQCKAMEACVIDLLAHYDAVAELMAAMGGWLENEAGSFTGLAVSYSRKFTNEKEEGKCGCLYVCVCERHTDTHKEAEKNAYFTPFPVVCRGWNVTNSRPAVLFPCTMSC